MMQIMKSRVKSCQCLLVVAHTMTGTDIRTQTFWRVTMITAFSKAYSRNENIAKKVKKADLRKVIDLFLKYNFIGHISNKEINN